MAWAGLYWTALRESIWLFAAYWAAFSLVFTGAILIALLDLRYIRMEYSIAKRELFRQTLGDETFRRDLKAKQPKPRAAAGHSGNGPRPNR